MTKYVMTLVALLMSVTIAWAQAPAVEQLNVELFPLSELKIGLKGTGYTVIRGTKVEPFNVEVLDLIPHGGFDGGPMVLARFSGPTVDFSNGIAGGYSGSPVYINGKLLGAVSMAIPYTDTHIGGITPIQSMLSALPDTEAPDYSGNTVLPPSPDGGKPVDEQGQAQITYLHDFNQAREFNDRMAARGIDRLAVVPMQSPVYFSAIAPEVLAEYESQLSEKLGPNFQLMDRPMGRASDMGLLLTGEDDTAGGADSPGLLLTDRGVKPPLVAGDAVAVSLVEGDVEMYAVGTVTYSDDQGRLLLFGHPMMQKGATNMPLGKAYVTWTFSSIERPFKEGVRLSSAGVMTKDLSAACGGNWKMEPDLLPVKIKIKDIDQQRETTKRFSVIRDPDLSPILIAMGMSQCSQEILNRQPAGTMRISYHIEGVGLKEPLRHENYYFDDSDVVMNAAMELLPLANLLQTNIYREVQLTKLEVLIEITRNRVNAAIDEAEIVTDDAAAAPDDVEPAAIEEGQVMPALPEPATLDETTLPDNNADRAGFNAGWAQRDPQRARWLQEPAPDPEAPPEGEMVPPGMEFPLETPPSNIVPKYKPGDTIRVRVRLQPYRADAQWREFEVKVPTDFPTGSTSLIVHGGGDLTSADEIGGKGRFLYGMGPIIDTLDHDLDAILEQVMEWPSNNQLLVTLQRPYDPNLDEYGRDAQGVKQPLKTDAKYQMEWVIYNGFMLPVEIVAADEVSETPPADEADAAAADDDEQPTGEDTELPF